MKYFNELSHSEQIEFFDSIDIVLSDCDGVLWHGKSMIEGAADVINKLRKLEKKVILISNNSINPVEYFKNKVKSANIDKFPDENLMNTTTAIIGYLKSINFNKRLYTVSSPGMFEDLKRAGYHCDNGANLSPKYVRETLNLDPEVGAVVVDGDLQLNYLTLAKAVHYLLKPDVLFIAGATEDWLTLSSNDVLFGPGQFLRMISSGSNRQPVVLGKPGKGLGELLIKRYEIEVPRRVLVIGDSIPQDIIFAHKQGFRSLLVLTGLTDIDLARKGIEEETTSSEDNLNVGTVKPEFYLNNLSELGSLLDEMISPNSSFEKKQQMMVQ